MDSSATSLPHHNAACRLLQYDTTHGHTRELRPSNPGGDEQRRLRRTHTGRVAAKLRNRAFASAAPTPTTPGHPCRLPVLSRGRNPPAAASRPRPCFQRIPRKDTPSDRTRCLPPARTSRGFTLTAAPPPPQAPLRSAFVREGCLFYRTSTTALTSNHQVSGSDDSNGARYPRFAIRPSAASR